MLTANLASGTGLNCGSLSHRNLLRVACPASRSSAHSPASRDRLSRAGRSTTRCEAANGQQAQPQPDDADENPKHAGHRNGRHRDRWVTVHAAPCQVPGARRMSSSNSTAHHDRCIVPTQARCAAAVVVQPIHYPALRRKGEWRLMSLPSGMPLTQRRCTEASDYRCSLTSNVLSGALLMLQTQSEAEEACDPYTRNCQVRQAALVPAALSHVPLRVHHCRCI